MGKYLRITIVAAVLMVVMAGCVYMPRDYVGKWTFAEQVATGRIVQTYNLEGDGRFELEKRVIGKAMRAYNVNICGEWRLEECDSKTVLTFKYDLDTFRCDNTEKSAEERRSYEEWNEECHRADEYDRVYGWPVLRLKGSTMLVGHPGNTLRLTRLRQ